MKDVLDAPRVKAADLGHALYDVVHIAVDGIVGSCHTLADKWLYRSGGR